MFSSRGLLLLGLACVCGVPHVKGQPAESERLREERAKAESELEAGMRASDPARRETTLRSARFELIRPGVAFEQITRATTDPDLAVRRAAFAVLAQQSPGGYAQTCEFLVRRAGGQFEFRDRDLVVARIVDGKIVLTPESARFVAEQSRLAVAAFAVVQPRFRAQLARQRKDVRETAKAEKLETALQRQTDEVREIIAARLKGDIDGDERTEWERCLATLTAPANAHEPAKVNPLWRRP